MNVSISEAARQLGYKSRSVLYRLRDSGLLDDYLDDDGIELAPPGLPSLAEHLKAVLQPQRRADPGERLDRGQLEAELTAERTRRLRMQNDLEEGRLIVAAELEPVLFRQGRAARDRFQRLPLEMAHKAVAMGLPSEKRYELELAWTEAVDAILLEHSKDPLGRDRVLGCEGDPVPA